MATVPPSRHPRGMEHTRKASRAIAALVWAIASAGMVSTSEAATSPRAARMSSLGMDVTAPSERFAWPVTPHTVLRRFDPPEVKWGSGHRGVDLAAGVGSQITAPSDGVITFAGKVAGRGVLTLRHPQGFDTTYEPVTDTLSVGSAVHRGDRIATLDSGGHCPQSCLHWGYKLDADTYRDPLTLVTALRPVLLPPV